MFYSNHCLLSVFERLVVNTHTDTNWTLPLRNQLALWVHSVWALHIEKIAKNCPAVCPFSPTVAKKHWARKSLLIFPNGWVPQLVQTHKNCIVVFIKSTPHKDYLHQNPLIVKSLKNDLVHIEALARFSGLRVRWVDRLRGVVHDLPPNFPFQVAALACPFEDLPD